MSNIERSGTGSRRPAAVVVRPAEVRDIDRVAEIERASFGDPWSRRSFTHLVDDPRVFFRVSLLPSGELVGYVVAWFVAGEGEIANIAVVPSARGRGIGAALLDAAMEAGAEHGAETLYLDVRETNAAARALYASRGFEQVGRRRSYYRNPVEDALVLRCRLDRRPLERRER